MGELGLLKTVIIAVGVPLRVVNVLSDCERVRRDSALRRNCSGSDQVHLWVSVTVQSSDVADLFTHAFPLAIRGHLQILLDAITPPVQVASKIFLICIRSGQMATCSSYLGLRPVAAPGARRQGQRTVPAA